MIKFMKELLKEIQELKGKYDNIETYNLFDLFNINENMHSDILADMLNPKGRHKNKQFLDLFLEALEIPKFKNIKEVVVNRELPTAEKKRMDIAIYDKTNFIILENKMHDAKDQPFQLFNYYKEALHNKYKPENIYILFLTKYGYSHSENSFPKEKQNEFGLVNPILCISFEKEILKWLNTCKTISENAPRSFYCIEMYIELIRKTINRDKYMEEIVKHLANNPSQMNAAIDVVKALQGRNFLEFNSETRNLILKNIESIVNKEPYFGKLVTNNNGTHNLSYLKNADVYFVVEKDCIYGELDDDKNTANNPSLEISGYDLNNKYLVALLTNNQDLIQEWITKTINYLTGEAENL